MVFCMVLYMQCVYLAFGRLFTAISQFIYDAWYTSLTPDREFPAETRRILNTAFGTLAQRARRMDMRQLLRCVHIKLWSSSSSSAAAASAASPSISDIHQLNAFVSSA